MIAQWHDMASKPSIIVHRACIRTLEYVATRFHRIVPSVYTTKGHTKCLREMKLPWDFKGNRFVRGHCKMDFIEENELR